MFKKATFISWISLFKSIWKENDSIRFDDKQNWLYENDFTFSWEIYTLGMENELYTCLFEAEFESYYIFNWLD